jgi:hypothetical protein
MITRVELNQVILSPISLLIKRMLSVTTTIDSAKERVTLSMTFIFLKKTIVQAKPGRKNTNMKPSIALIMDKGSGEAKANPKSSLIGDSQSMPYSPLHQYLDWMKYDFN